MSFAVKQSGSNISPSLNIMHSLKRSTSCNCMPVRRLKHCYKLEHQLRCYTVCQVQCSYIDAYRITGNGQGVNDSARTKRLSDLVNQKTIYKVQCLKQRKGCWNREQFCSWCLNESMDAAESGCAFHQIGVTWKSSAADSLNDETA